MDVYKKISKEKAVELSILKELEIHTSIEREHNPHNHPNVSDYATVIKHGDFGNLVQDMQENGLIRNVVISRPLSMDMVFWDGAAITDKGKQYIIDHSAIMRTYKGLKEFQSWVDTVTGIANVMKP